jgi:hypothetical protein
VDPRYGVLTGVATEDVASKEDVLDEPGVGKGVVDDQDVDARLLLVGFFCSFSPSGLSLFFTLDLNFAVVGVDGRMAHCLSLACTWITSAWNFSIVLACAYVIVIDVLYGWICVEV